MSFETLYTKTFLNELSALPVKAREKAEKIAFISMVGINPSEMGNIEKLKGYKDKYKIRVGDYRIGLTIDKEKQVIIFQRIVHRKDIYKKFP